MHDQEREHQDNILTTAAKAVGKAAGKIAHIAGIEAEAPAPQPKKSVKPARLEKKNKPRLPRKEKKALAKKKAA